MHFLRLAYIFSGTGQDTPFSGVFLPQSDCVNQMLHLLIPLVPGYGLPCKSIPLKQLPGFMSSA